MSELEGQVADMQEEHAHSQQEAQERMRELASQLQEACTSAAEQLAQVLSFGWCHKTPNSL